MFGIAPLLLTYILGVPQPVEGVIAGVVVNTTPTKPCPCAASVILQVQAEHGQFAPFRETKADSQGRFRFDHLPLGIRYRYLLGASHDEIYYPGPHIRLTETQSNAVVELRVRDTLAEPCPLVIRRLDITIAPEPGCLKVTESMLIDNPSSACYVGKAKHEGEEPVTLALAIPSDFERTTFQKEFFGRRFSLQEGKVATGVPWLPGSRELKYTYVLRNTDSYRRWERPLDLPCSQVQVRVQTADAGAVQCNLPAASVATKGETVFQSQQGDLPAGFVLRVELGRLPVAWMQYGRWLALVVLLVLIAAASGIMLWRQRKSRASIDGRGPSQPREKSGAVRPPHRRDSAHPHQAAAARSSQDR